VQRAITVIVVCFAAVFLVFFVKENAAESTDSKPVYDWQIRVQETRVLDPGASRFGWASRSVQQIGPPTTNGVGRVKVHIRSTVPVDAGFAPASWSDDFASGKAPVSSNLDKFESLQRNILEADLLLDVPPNSFDRMLVVQDTRDTSNGHAFVTGIAAALGSKGQLDELTARNDVTITIYDYKCVKNCRGN
jgi:hypothetical protein